MSTSIKHAGTERTWEGPLENWQAHNECIKHWCDGGRIEVSINGEFRQILRYSFDPDLFYRIKKREPKTGEVYLNRSGIPHVFGFCLAGGGHFGFMSLCGSMATIDDHAGDFEYAAPDVESYVARKFLTQQVKQERCYIKGIVKEAARLDEE